MKIVIYSLIPLGYPGGSEKYMAGLAKYFSKKYKVELISSHQYRMIVSYVYRIISFLKIKHVHYVKRKTGNALSYDFSFLNLIPFTSKNELLKKKLLEADVIYAKNEFPDLLILYLLLGKNNYSKKTIVGVHSIIFLPNTQKGLNRRIHDFLYLGSIYKKFLKNSKLIHVPNSAYVKYISGKFKISSKKIAYVPHPIEWNTKFLDTNDDSFIILWLGRLTNQKGVNRLKTVIDNLSEVNKFKSLNFIIAGQGPDEKIINELTLKYKNVKFLGYVKNVAQLYLKADLCLSTSYFEVLPYSVLEAQSFGVPVVSFNIDGPSDIITDKRTGYIVKNVKEYCKKIEKLFKIKENNKQHYLRLRKNIYIKINRDFAKEKIYNTIEKVFINETNI